jgi:excisionase family DNA binding protein
VVFVFFVVKFFFLNSISTPRKEAMNDPPHPPDNSLVFLTAQEAADLLRVQRRSLYRLVQQQRIPYRRVGRAIRFERNELLAWTQPQSNIQGKES